MRARDDIGDAAFHQLEEEFDWIEMGSGNAGRVSAVRYSRTEALAVKHTIRLLAMACAIFVAATPVRAQAPATSSIQAEMLKDWTDLKDALVKIANEMPEEGYSFKPTPPQETFGRRVVHIGVGANRLLRSVLHEERRHIQCRRSHRDGGHLSIPEPHVHA